MTRKALFSTLGVLVAAVASVATSAPEPDWDLDDSVEGDLTLAPDQEEATVKLLATAEVVDANLSFDVRLDPVPARGTTTADLGDTPIVLFVSPANESGTTVSPSQYLSPIPSDPSDANYWAGSNAAVGPKEGAREFTVRISWKSPNPSDYMTSKCSRASGSEQCDFISVTRPHTERQPTKIHWRAKIHSDGYDDQPRGSKVDLAVAQ